MEAGNKRGFGEVDNEGVEEVPLKRRMEEEEQDFDQLHPKEIIKKMRKKGIACPRGEETEGVFADFFCPKEKEFWPFVKTFYKKALKTWNQQSDEEDQRRMETFIALWVLKSPEYLIPMTTSLLIDVSFSAMSPENYLPLLETWVKLLEFPEPSFDPELNEVVVRCLRALNSHMEIDFDHLFERIIVEFLEADSLQEKVDTLLALHVSPSVLFRVLTGRKALEDAQSELQALLDEVEEDRDDVRYNALLGRLGDTRSWREMAAPVKAIFGARK